MLLCFDALFPNTMWLAKDEPVGQDPAGAEGGGNGVADAGGLGVACAGEGLLPGIFSSWLICKLVHGPLTPGLAS